MRWLEHRRARAFIVLAGLVLALPALAVGFFADDWYMLGAIRRTWPTAPAWWDLYNFVPSTDAGIQAEISQGSVPWWTPYSLRLHLVRPLSSALLALDEHLFGAAPVGWHLHSLVWWAVLLLVVAALMRRILPGPGPTAALALLIYAVAPAHLYAYGWPSARHLAVGATPALAGLLAHLAWRGNEGRHGFRAGRWLCPLGVAVGLSGSEAALGVAALWLSYEALGPLRDPGPSPVSLREQALARAPGVAVPAVLVAVYLVLYRLAGGTIASSDAYVTPLSHPLLYAAAVAERLPMFLGNVLVGVPVELAVAFGSAPFIAVGLLASALAFWLWRSVRAAATAEERAAVRWLVPGGVMAIVGACGGLPGARSLLVPNVGFAAVLAVILRSAWALGVARPAMRRVAVGLGVLYVGLAPFATLAQAAMMGVMGRAGADIARALPGEVAPARRVFILVGSDPMASMYARFTLLGMGGHELDCVVRLTGTAADYRVTRTDATTLSLEPLGRPLLRAPFETLYRTRALPFAAGDEVSTCGARVRVAAVEEGSPTRLEVAFDTSLDDAGLATVVWDGQKLARVHLAEGETQTFPWREGPMRTQ